jgi:hypothetical protein
VGVVKAMKGQFFILVSVLIVITLIILRISTTFPVEQYEVTVPDNYLNIQREFVNTIDLSLLNEDTALGIKDNVDNFADFSRKIMQRKGYDEKVIYSFNYNGTKVVLGNFMGESMKNVNIIYNENI